LVERVFVTRVEIPADGVNTATELIERFFVCYIRERGMPVPLHQAKADLFRTLGHPVRIRVLELLQDGPRPVHELLAEIDVEPSNLSQQLAVLRRAGIVVSSRDRATVLYSLGTSDVADLMQAARRFLTDLLTDQEGLLAELRTGA
jgi:ArsR family transcriptional regulator